MSKKQKLELTWIGKENRPKLEPRILLEDPAKSLSREASGDGRRHLRQPADLRRQPAGVEGTGGGVCGQGEVRVHRSAVQHRQRLHALRRRGGAFDLAVADARPAGDYPAVAVGGWFAVDHH